MFTTWKKKKKKSLEESIFLPRYIVEKEKNVFLQGVFCKNHLLFKHNCLAGLLFYLFLVLVHVVICKSSWFEEFARWPDTACVWPNFKTCGSHVNMMNIENQRRYLIFSFHFWRTKLTGGQRDVKIKNETLPRLTN